MFTVYDLRKQLLLARSPGLVQRLLMMFPGMGDLRKIQDDPNTRKGLSQTIGVIDAMTVAERENPRIIDRARRKRIARGAGVPVSMVNGVIQMIDLMDNWPPRNP